MTSREIFSKTKFKDQQLISVAVEVFGIEEKDILVIHNSNGWLKKDKQVIIYEYKGLLDKEDDDEYCGYYYYDIFFENRYFEKISDLQNKLGRDTVVTL